MCWFIGVCDGEGLGIRDQGSGLEIATRLAGRLAARCRPVVTMASEREGPCSMEPEHDSPAESSGDAALLRQFLATRDVPCPVCGYNLRGNSSPKCSECGARLDVRVGSTDLRITPWLVALIGTVLPMGAASFWALLMLVMIRQFQNPQWTTTLGALLGSILVNVAIVHFLIQRRRTFWKRAPRRQWRIVAIILGVDAAIFISAFLLPSLFW
jgi:hypothetical protein